MRFWPPFWEALGAPGGSFWKLLIKHTKNLDFEYVPYENHDFVGSGIPFFELFRAKMVEKTAVGKKSAQVTTKININSLRDALGGAWGRKNIGKSKKPSGRISWPFYEKTGRVPEGPAGCARLVKAYPGG